MLNFLKEEQFKPFNPNGCNLGHKVFNNFMRQEIKNVDLEENKGLDNMEKDEE